MIVGADAHIGPFGSYEFAADYRKIGAFCRADVGIGPYRAPYGFAAAHRAEQSPAPTSCVRFLPGFRIECGLKSTTLPVRGSYGTDI